MHLFSSFLALDVVRNLSSKAWKMHREVGTATDLNGA